jgi:hypothetical protein
MDKTKPIIESVVVKQLPEESPDLSYLETKMEGNKIIDSVRYTNDDIKKYGLAKVKKWIEKDTQRLNDYGRTWEEVIIRAEATILIPQKTIPASYLIQKITSGGLGGIESDSGKKELERYKEEQLEELEEVLETLGIKGKDIKSLLQKTKKADFGEVVEISKQKLQKVI